MSKKHVEEYFKVIADQYSEMIDLLKELEQQYETNIIEPERLDKIKESIIPLKTNYQRISYIMYLLNMPNKKEKQKKYIKALEVKQDKEGSLQKVKTENDTVIDNLKGFKV